MRYNFFKGVGVMYQYTIQVQYKNGCPFHINTYDYFDVALIYLNNYIKLFNIIYSFAPDLHHIFSKISLAVRKI